MSRGGTRPGAGRPRGSITATTKELVARVNAAMVEVDGRDLGIALAMVSEDPEAPFDVRLAATRRLSGALLGKLILADSVGWLAQRPASPDPFD
ncbi:hypothetical protein [Rhodospirillaceae bacterium SYSU D60014]|uniref:hypothetical protein n=1 Tax=Virgifigura deserti TaxID=2268457 RepID=UPI0013C502C2